MTALTRAALLHLCLDFPLHHDNGRPHFRPLTGWIFEGPLSCWDRRHGAVWIAPLEAAAVIGAAGVLWRQQLGIVFAAFTTLLLVTELWVVGQWLFNFIDSQQKTRPLGTR